MKVISWNVNGLRAVYKRGFIKWLEKENADIVCLQEIKAQKDQLPKELQSPMGYYTYFNCARKKGYSGVLVYTKKKAQKIGKNLSLSRFDREGRMLELKFPRFTLINLYLPHGGRAKENLDYKLHAYEKLLQKLKRIKSQNVILIGDFNIAHTELDLARPKQNESNIMFTPTERQQIGKITDFGFCDTFRRFNKKGSNYTWWSYAHNARKRNLGWRIDYCFTSKNLTSKLKNAYIQKQITLSDHCPIGIEF